LVQGGVSPSKIRTGTYQSTTDALLRSKDPTVLFELPKTAYFGPATFCLCVFVGTIAGWYAIQGFFVNDFEDQQWLKIASRIAAVVLSGFTAYMFLGTTRRIRSIAAVPINGTLFLRIQYRRAIPLPWRKPVVMTVKPKDVTLQSRLVDPRFMKGTAEPQTAGADLTKPQSSLSSIRTRFSASKNKIKNAWFIMFINTRRIWTREGFLPLKISGKNGVWRLDMYEGTFRDGGKPLDRLVSYDFAL
jgi:hypothetical protein